MLMYEDYTVYIKTSVPIVQLGKQSLTHSFEAFWKILPIFPLPPLLG